LQHANARIGAKQSHYAGLPFVRLLSVCGASHVFFMIVADCSIRHNHKKLGYLSCAVAVAAGLFCVNQAKLTVGAVEHFFAAIILIDDDLGCAIAKMAGSANSGRAATTTVLALLHEMVSFGLH
jgi:hypothetical protein